MSEKDRTNAIMSKISATQNVMKNKFEKAYTNRMNREQNLSPVSEQLNVLPSTLMNETESSKEDVSLRSLFESKNKAHQLRLAKKSYSNQAIQPRSNAMKLVDSENIIRKYSDDPNKLSDRLRFLLTSQIAGVNHTEEINTIISKLHNLNIIV